VRRHPDQRDALIAAFGMLDRMEVGIVEVDQEKAIVLAERSGLSAYDASYLWLARATRPELITLDGRLEAASAADG
jgi:predicted nucleic acid-binding protein